jgi:hypothetical protein
MARLEYEIGLAGREEDVVAFSERIKEYGDYWTGRNDSESDRSFARYAWEGTLDKETIIGWVQQWSIQYPHSECYFTIRTPEYSRLYGELNKYEVGAYRSGYTQDHRALSSHEEFLAYFGENAKCECEGRYARRNPLSSPFMDCPPRVDPPLAWAVENIMVASEMIGRRR